MANSRTPAHLVHYLGLQPEYPVAKISAVWEGFQNYAPREGDADPEKNPKKEFISMMWGAQILGAIEEHSGDPNWVRRVPLSSFARFWSVDVSTACRRIGKFAPSDGRWDEDRRRRMSEQQKALAQKEKQPGPEWEDALRKAFQERGQLSSADVGAIIGVERARAIQCARQYGFNIVATGTAPRERKNGSQPKLYSLSDGPILKRRTVRSVKMVHQFLNKNGGYGMANGLTLHMDRELKPRVEEGKRMPSPTANVEQMARAFGADWFDSTQEGINNYKGVSLMIKDLPQMQRCICQVGQLCLLPGNPCPKCNGFGAIPVRYPAGHARAGEMVPLYDYAKNLFCHLVLKGLTQFGKVDNQTQEKMAKDLGCSVDLLVENRDQLELLKLIRVRTGDIKRLCQACDLTFWCHWRENKHGEGKWVGECPKCHTKAGTVVDRKPDVWIYIADRMLDEEIAEREYQRFQQMRAKVEAAAFARAEKVHVELLKAWRGQERSVGAFFKEMRRRLAAENIDKRVIDTLFPFYRE